MNQFRIYEFENKDICCIPIHWVQNGQVKFDCSKARDYMKKGKLPYKKWKAYNVRPVSDRVFDSYEEALRAEKLYMENSEVDTTDLEVDLPIKRVIRPNAKYSSSSESENEQIPDPPYVLENNNEIEYSVIVSSKTTSEQDVMSEAGASGIADVLDVASKTQLEVINKKLDKILNILESNPQIIQQENFKGSQAKFDMVTLPLTNIETLRELEKVLEDPQNIIRFKQFLYKYSCSNLRTAVKYIVGNVFSLDLQSQINWSGREKKTSIKDLIQTKSMLEVLHEYSRWRRVKQTRQIAPRKATKLMKLSAYIATKKLWIMSSVRSVEKNSTLHA